LRARILASAGRHAEACADIAELLRVWRQSEVRIGSFWTADVAFAASQMGRDEVVVAALRNTPATGWVEAARAVATAEFQRAAALYADIGSAPDEALARLQAGKRLLASGRSTEAAIELDRALEFHRRVGAERHVQEGESLLAAVR